MSDRTPPQNPLQAGKHVAGNEQTEFTRSLPETQSESAKRIDLAAIIDAATDYARRGWSVIPVGLNKKPTLRAWKAQQSVRTDPKDVPAWFKKLRGVAGVGIILGEVSGGLYVRDFDEAAEYERWAKAYPQHAQTMPTVKTARGFHVYGRWKGVKTKDFGTGELRSEGLYVCAPPSTHASGAVYSWLVPLPVGDVPDVDPKAAGLAQAWGETLQPCATERTERTERPRDGAHGADGANRDTEHIEAISHTSFDEKTLAMVEDAINRTLPPMHGKRNKHVFRFARALKGIPALRDITRENLAILRPFVHEWFTRALPRIITKDFGTTWGEFGYGWGRVKFPEGEDAVAKALERAEGTEPPLWSKDYSSTHRLLASLCRELQRAARDGPFFLSNELAGDLLEVDKGTANRWFHAFINDGTLVIVEPPSTGKATRYRYVADDL